MSLEAYDPAATYNACATAHGWPTMCDPALVFEAPEFADLLAIWRTAAEGGHVPLRSAFSARQLKSHLPYITIYERFESDRGGYRYRVRLMGTAFAQVYGDLTGKVIDESVPADMVPRFHVAIEQVLRARIPLRFVARVGMNGKNYLVAEYLMAQLADEQGNAMMVLCRAHFGSEAQIGPRQSIERHILSH